MYPKQLKYSTEHMWLKIEADDKGVVGITHYYQEQLRNIVFIELPKVGIIVSQDQVSGIIESSKATSDLYSPVSGTIIEVNNLLESKPSLINSDPYANGWIYAIEINNPNEIDALLSADEYIDLIK